tara:strand:- start:38 stop:826 length:789 start_codon:yes stop_codon:yes gene_type:complete
MKPVKIDNPNNTYAPCKGEYHQMFPTPIFQGKLNLNHKEIAQHCRDVVTRCEKGNPETEYTTYFDNDLREETHNQPWYNSFANRMKDSYIQFIRDMWYIPTSDINRHNIHLFTWVNVYNEPHQHETHNHVKSRLSGTYYVSTDNSSTPIKFFNPNMSSVFGHSGNDDKMRYTEQLEGAGTPGGMTDLEFRPQTGDFMLWPSYLLHTVPMGQSRDNLEVRPNTSGLKLPTYERISISFNLQHAEDLGWYHHGTEFDYGVLENG